MSFGITKTIPAGAGIEAVDSLYDGSLEEYEFHMAGKPPSPRAPFKLRSIRTIADYHQSEAGTIRL